MSERICLSENEEVANSINKMKETKTFHTGDGTSRLNSSASLTNFAVLPHHPSILKPRSLLFFLFLFSFSPVFAKDEVVLKEGKTLSGKIIHEDDKSITITTFPNMVVSVEKSKVSEIKRTPKATKAPVWTPPAQTSTATVKTSTAAVAASTAPAKPAAPAAPVVQPKPEILAIRPISSTDTRKEGAINVVEVVVHRVHKVKGAQFSDVKSADHSTVWTSTWSGTPEAFGDRFRWKEGLLQSTITVTLPAWSPAVPPKDDQIKAWNEFLPRTADYEAGKVLLYKEKSRSLATALSELQSKNEASLREESNALIKKFRDQADKRIQGYERVQSTKKNAPKK